LLVELLKHFYIQNSKHCMLWCHLRATSLMIVSSFRDEAEFSFIYLQTFFAISVDLGISDLDKAALSALLLVWLAELDDCSLLEESSGTRQANLLPPLAESTLRLDDRIRFAIDNLRTRYRLKCTKEPVILHDTRYRGNINKRAHRTRDDRTASKTR